jgi:hypothetical protein
MVKRFAAEAKANPTRFYRVPREVLQDRRLTKEEKLAILEAWEHEARELAVASDETMSDGEPTMLQDVLDARLELSEENAPAGGTNAPTKHGVRRI